MKVINWFLKILKFAENFRCIALERIKRMLLGGNFYLGLLKIILQSFLFYLKKLLKIIFLCPFFEVKNQNEPIAIKIHTHKILLMQLNLLLAIRYRKMGWKSNINIHFSKQMFFFFCPLLLGMWKNVLSFFRMLLLLIFINIIFECCNLLTDLVP